MSGVIVTIKHVREELLCSKGARVWFEHHGLSWADFIRSGIAVETMEATGDALALRVAARARQEADHGRQ